MSYTLHIVRGPEWFENPKHQISEKEWAEFIASEPELTRIDDASAKLASSSEEDGQILRLSSGSIAADYPQPPLLSKMFAIAKHFNGYVVSDDGDIFSLGENGKIRVEAP